MFSTDALQLVYPTRLWDGLVVGRAGLDLYPQPVGCKIRNSTTFASDVGGSGGNIAIAMGRAGGHIGLISALSDDPVGQLVRQRLQAEGIDLQLTDTTQGEERTSLALAEVRQQDCEVVIYRNNPADLQITCNKTVEQAIDHSSNLVVTGTSLIAPSSRQHTLAMMTYARSVDCQVWLDLDYRAWNWPNLKITRAVYGEAADLAHVLVGNEAEFSVLTDRIEAQIAHSKNRYQIIVLKRGANGCSLFAGSARLDTGIYTVSALKPYGAGDAFLGNLIINHMATQDWQQAIEAGSAAAALVVSQQGCGNAMPKPKELQQLQQQITIQPTAKWS
jgi:5-dehydro-2-deoxygluconokinase